MVWWPYATLLAFIFLFYIHQHSLRPISISSQLSAQWVEPPWGAEPRFELGPALQQASALPTEPHCTLHVFLVERTPFFLFLKSLLCKEGEISNKKLFWAGERGLSRAATLNIEIRPPTLIPILPHSSKYFPSARCLSRALVKRSSCTLETPRILESDAHSEKFS